MRVILAFLLSVGICAAAHPAKKAPRRGPASRKVQPPAPPSFDAGTINNPSQPELNSGDKGSGIVRAQILLGRSHFSCGEIDGFFGTNLAKTIAAFQEARGLPQSGRLDSATWAVLNGDTAPALTTYAITPEDVAGPFVAIPTGAQAQAALPAMGYSSPLEELAEHFHVSPALLQALNPGTDFTKAGQPMMVPNILVMPPDRAAGVEVRKGESSVRAYGEDGKLLAFYVATAGSTHDPLPIGEWKINGVARNPKFHYNPTLFWDAKPGDSKTVIQPGPNNPVGLVWIDLSHEHTGIHGTPDPGKVGHAFSHGCIRLTNWDAVELAGMVRPGTPALLKE